MAPISKVAPRTALLVLLIGAWASSNAHADPVTFSTPGVFSVSGTNVVNFTNINGTTTITFNGTTDSVNTPGGVSFGDIVVTTTVPPNVVGPAIAGNFTLNVFQFFPAGVGSLVGSLSGTLGFNTGVTTLSFSTTSINIGGFVYAVNPAVYTIAVPVSGVGGGAGTGTTSLEGSAAGGPPTPTPTAIPAASPTPTPTPTPD